MVEAEADEELSGEDIDLLGLFLAFSLALEDELLAGFLVSPKLSLRLFRHFSDEDLSGFFTLEGFPDVGCDALIAWTFCGGYLCGERWEV